MLRWSACPPELLGEIFLASIPPFTSRYHHPQQTPQNYPVSQFRVALSHVCRQWRASALAFPALWSSIDIEQNEDNDRGASPTRRLLELYLERSGNHSLAFRLSYNHSNRHPFLKLLVAQMARWETVYIEFDALSRIGSIHPDKPFSLPRLRSLCCFNYHYPNDVEGPEDASANLDPSKDDRLMEDARFLEFIPWSQLQRHIEHSCGWWDHHWDILKQLVDVVELRVSFHDYASRPQAIQMPRVRTASFDFASETWGLDSVEEVLECFELPLLQSLNLKLDSRGPPVFEVHIPGKFKYLKVLRLGGWMNSKITNGALSRLLTATTALTDFLLTLTGVDAIHLLTLLTPKGDSTAVVLPNLQALRLEEIKSICDLEEDPMHGLLLSLLQTRFNGRAGADSEFSQLRLFELYTEKSIMNKASLLTCLAPEIYSTWNMRIYTGWMGDLWHEEIEEELL